MLPPLPAGLQTPALTPRVGLRVGAWVADQMDERMDRCTGGQEGGRWTDRWEGAADGQTGGSHTSGWGLEMWLEGGRTGPGRVDSAWSGWLVLVEGGPRL